MKTLCYIFNVAVHFKCGYKNRNGISEGSLAEKNNPSILGRGYLIHGVRCSQNWRKDKWTLDWASRNHSQNDAAQLSSQASCPHATVRIVRDQEVAIESAEFESHHCDPGGRKWPGLPDTCKAGDRTPDHGCNKIQQLKMQEEALHCIPTFEI